MLINASITTIQPFNEEKIEWANKFGEPIKWVGQTLSWVGQCPTSPPVAPPLVGASSTSTADGLTWNTFCRDSGDTIQIIREGIDI